MRFIVAALIALSASAEAIAEEYVLAISPGVLTQPRPATKLRAFKSSVLCQTPLALAIFSAERTKPV